MISGVFPNIFLLAFSLTAASAGPLPSLFLSCSLSPPVYLPLSVYFFLSQITLLAWLFIRKALVQLLRSIHNEISWFKINCYNSQFLETRLLSDRLILIRARWRTGMTWRVWKWKIMRTWSCRNHSRSSKLFQNTEMKDLAFLLHHFIGLFWAVLPSLDSVSWRGTKGTQCVFSVGTRV